MKFLRRPLIKLAQFGIDLYRLFISPFFGQRCRFFPSCSEYANQAVEQLGIFRGMIKTFQRLLCCHPFHPGGYDPISK